MKLQNKLLLYLRPESRILDFGCSPGRDTKCFLDKGFRVDAIDGSAEFVELASEYTQTEVKQMLFLDLSAIKTYNGMWGCSFILHLTQDELVNVFEKMRRPFVSDCILYISFKNGTKETKWNGRHFTDMAENRNKSLLERIGVFLIEKM